MRQHETVQTVMTRDPVTVWLDTPFKDVVELMAERGISAVPVVDQAGVPVGVVSEADLLAKAEYQDQDRPPSRFAGPQRRHDWVKAQALTAAELMSRNLMTITPDTPLPVAARELANAGVRRLLVTGDGGRLVGILSRRDLLRPFLRDDEQILADVRGEILQWALWLRPSDVDVAVLDGVVTLTGTVERRSEAEIAVRLTHALPGVVAVQDRLEYSWDDEHAKLGTSNLLH
jgi:CBS domain-containing protein